jgi:hypothetical protein
MTKAYDHGARKYWILNVGDLKPAEIDIDYFLQLATDEPKIAAMGQRQWLTQWFAQQFPKVDAAKAADAMKRYYALNFIRKPEFMGFNGYNDGINRTAFNPLAWPSDGQRDQNHARAAEWSSLQASAEAIAKTLPPSDAAAFFELVGYPIAGAAAMNEKFLATDLTYLDAARLDSAALSADTARAHAAYDTIQRLTGQYNRLEGGKWDGMMSAAPRDRHVFEMPRTATIGADVPLPAAWGADKLPVVETPGITGFVERAGTVSMNAAHFTRSHDSTSLALPGHWRVLADLGISGDSVVYGEPGLSAGPAVATSGPQDSAWLEYDFVTTSDGPAKLTLDLLPTFALDSDHRLRYAVALDGGTPVEMDLTPPATAKASEGAGDGPSDSGWAENVLRNSAVATVPLRRLEPGRHTLRLFYRDPGVVFEHLVVIYAGAPPAYPVPPETR